MARDIINMSETLPMSLIVFSQEMRRDLEAGVAGRGSVGLMSGYAAKVARLTDPYEHLIRSRNLRNLEDKATVHEVQMHAPKTTPRIVTVKNEDGTDLVEVIGRDKWSLMRQIGEILVE
jgi:hypothetical protein